MPNQTFSQRVVENFAPAVSDRLWSGSWPMRRPLFRDLPPTVQRAWARQAQAQGRDLGLSDDPSLYDRTAAIVAELYRLASPTDD